MKLSAPKRPRLDQEAHVRVALAYLYQDEPDTPQGRLRARRRLLVAQLGWEARQLPLNRLRFVQGWDDDELVAVVLELRRHRYQQMPLPLAALKVNEALADLDPEDRPKPKRRRKAAAAG